MANYVSKIRAEFDARQATEAMYALSERARGLNKLLAEQRKRFEETGDIKIKDTIDGNIKRLEVELAAVEKLNKVIEKSLTTESAFQQVLNGDTGAMSVARLEGAQRNARAIMRNINPQDENALDQMDEVQRVINESGKRVASLKNGFMDAMRTVEDGVEGKAIPELKRLEAALIEAQKFSTDQKEWDGYAEAIGKVRLEMQSAGMASVQMEEANARVAASLKYGFEDAFETFSKGIDGMALPELKRLEASLTETQKFSVDAEEWQKYGSAIDQVKIKIQGITGEYLSVEKAMGYAGEIEKQTFKGTIADLEQAKKLLTDYRKTIAQTADGADELKKIDKNLEVIEQQIKGTYLTTEKFNEILNNPKGKSFDELKQAVEKAEKQLYGMRRETDEEREAFIRLHEQIEGAKEELKDFGDAQEDASNSMEDLIDNAKRLAAAYLGLQGFQQVFQDNLDLSDQMANVRKTTGMTAETVASLSESIKSIDSRAANEQLMALAATAGQLGLSAEQDVLGFTKAANQITVSLDELGTDGVLELMKVAQVSGALDAEMGNVETTLLKVGSAINELSAASSATAGPITDFIGRVGGVASTAKMTMSQIAALGATTDALAISAELAGTQTNIFIGGMQKNTKAVADLLGVTKGYVQELMDNGQAMDLFVDVMEKLGDLNANELEDFLKQMGSSGSRATQVFSTLSKNVDQLRANLQVSNDAYRDGVSITEEYNKVNDTAAGKFARLKNEIREMFISNSAQKFFGNVIDGLRTVVRWIAEDGPIVKGLKIVTAYVAALKLGVGSMVLSAGAAMKTLGTGIMALANITGTMLGRIGVSLGLVTVKTQQARIEWKKLDAAMKANIWGAVIAAIGAVVYKLWDMHKAAKEAAVEVGRFNEKLNEEKRSLDNLFTPLKNSNIAQNERSRLISEINSKYGRYLGYMLSETNSAIQLADAHALIAKRIREEAYEKRILDQESAVRQKHEEDVNAAYGGIETAVREGKKGNADVTDITDMLKDVVDKNMDKIVEAGKNFPRGLVDKIDGMTNRLVADGKLTRDGANKARTALFKYIDEAKDQAVEINKATANTRADLRNVQRSITGDINANLNNLVGNIKNFGNAPAVKAAPAATVPSGKTEIKLPGFEIQTHEWKGNAEAKAETQAPLPSWKPTVNVKNIEEVKQFVKAQDNLRGYLEANAERINDDTRKTAEMYLLAEDKMKELRKLLPKDVDATGGTYDENGIGGNSSRGGGRSQRAAVTASYSNMSPDALVERKKKMKEAIGSIGTDDDVKTLIKEDQQLAAAFKGRAADMKSVIEWYNQERLKIQDELYSRNLTSTGEFKDSKKGAKNFGKQLQTDFDTYLKILDAYYTERKARIEKAQSEEGMSQAEAQQLEIENETVWRKHRMELQQIYLGRGERIAKEERQRIYNILGEQDEEDPKFVEQTIARSLEKLDLLKGKGEQGLVEYRKIESKLTKDIATDLYKQQNAVAKQVEAIEKIIAQERPFDGLTKNLQDNLSTMGILFADLNKKRQEAIAAGLEPEDDTHLRGVKQTNERMLFLLREAENAYSLTFDELEKRMREQGFNAWADALTVDDKQRQATIAALHTFYDSVQDAIKKESSQIKKQVDIAWKDALVPDGDGAMKSLKDTYERVISQMGLMGDQVKRANSLIGAGQASERVADRLAIKQMEVRLAMQQHYYNLIKAKGAEHIRKLQQEADEHKRLGEMEEYEMKLLDLKHARTALALSDAEEQTKIMEQQNAIANQLEETQNRLYTQLKEWGDLLASSMREVMEAIHAGDKEYYNELAKLELTGRGGPGAGTYVVIDDEGTSDAKAHYEYLDQRQAIERQREIEQQNALAEAWKKVFDDINAKISETITDQLNAALQNAAIYDNTAALRANTEALTAMSEAVSNSVDNGAVAGEPLVAGKAAGEPLVDGKATGDWTPEWQKAPQQPAQQGEWMAPMMPPAVDSSAITAPWAAYAEGSRDATKTITDNNKKAEKSTKASFAAMTAAANMYGIAYQTMANDNLSTAQKVEMMIVQAAGQAMISMLTAQLSADTGATASQAPNWVSKTLSSLGPIAGPAAVGVFTALIGGLMGIALSKVSKSKSQIAQATGASASAGKLTTGMLTYAEGNVNEFSDPKSLTPGRTYDVDAADGRTYRARYMGTNPSTHLTNGPEFHLAGERGREMIIDAGTTRQITMNDNEIWHAIQTLSSGGRMRRTSRRGVRAFADGNVDEFEEMLGGGTAEGETGGMDIAAMTEAMNRQTAVQEALLERLNQPIVAQNIWTGPDGIPNMYNKMQKEAKRHGVKFL